MFGRLEHHGVAGGKRRRQLPHRQHQRRVPGGDRHHHPKRLVSRVVEDAGYVVRYNCAFDLVGKPGVVVKVLGQSAQLWQHIDQPLAIVARLNHCQFLDMALQVGGDTAQQLASGAGRHGPPGGRFEGCTRRGHGALSVNCAAAGNQRPGRTIGRVERLQPLAASSVRPDAADQLAVGAQHRCIAARHVGRLTHSSRIGRVGVGRLRHGHWLREISSHCNKVYRDGRASKWRGYHMLNYMLPSCTFVKCACAVRPSPAVRWTASTTSSSW